MVEELTHLRKSKPVILAAGIIWAMIGAVYASNGMPHAAEMAVKHNILEYAELLLFLLVAMTYINALTERGVFDWLRSWLVNRGFGFRKLFWMTGILSFFISPIADNLTTALLMCAVVLAVGGTSTDKLREHRAIERITPNNLKFITIACINIVVASNAGGAFSPFGDITTLMVWQKGIVQFQEFFVLFVPSAVNFLIPATIMHFAIPDENPSATSENVEMKKGSIMIIMLFLLTIATAVSFHNLWHLPPMLGMMTGLAYLQFYGYYLKRHYKRETEGLGDDSAIGSPVSFDVFEKVARAEWDTLLFFFGIVLAVGGLGFIGYLSMLSELMYTDLGPTYANIMVGILSAIVDNIPVMFAVLTMMPDMSHTQWLLVTLTAGVGGSMLSIGSAAGVALMGQARGVYTFMSHLRWTWAIGLGYAASIYAHLLLN
jgi:NhaD family Na+/H+ antiporter